MLKPYLKRIYEVANRGDAREESYYSILEDLLKEYIESVDLSACRHAQAGQYFEGMAKEVWEYQIGGYQVCNKWLKDRKKRFLSLDDIKHYCKITTSLQKTIEIQKAIGDIYPEVEKETIEMLCLAKVTL
jgi:hypothetical protein